MDAQRRFEQFQKTIARQGRDLSQLRARVGRALTRISTNETGLVAIDTRLDALEAFRATNEVVRDYAAPADSTISTTETVEATCTLPVPAGWGGYTLEAEASYRVAETGTLTAARLHVIRLRLTNTAGAELGVSRVIIELAAPDNQNSAAVVGSLEGQTATGNINVVLTAITPGDTGQTTIAEMYMRARAVRTS